MPLCVIISSRRSDIGCGTYSARLIPKSSDSVDDIMCHGGANCTAFFILESDLSIPQNPSLPRSWGNILFAPKHSAPDMCKRSIYIGHTYTAPTSHAEPVQRLRLEVDLFCLELRRLGAELLRLLAGTVLQSTCETAQKSVLSHLLA